MSKKYKNVIFYILSFILPSIILGITFYIKKITPFGDYSIVSGDMELQFVPFINEFSEKVKHGDSLMYSWCRGMGYDFIGEIAYYLASPLNVIFLFFKRENILTGISLLVALKSSLCGLTMFTYLKHHFHPKNDNLIQNNFIMISLSSCYALCAYVLYYYLLIMWLDCMIMLPLIILSLEMLIDNKKPYLYSLTLGIAIFTNYYIGFMVCFFVVLYFFYYIFNEYSRKSTKELLYIMLRFTTYSIIGGCLSAVTLIPEIISLSKTASVKSHSLFINLMSANYDFGTTFYRYLMSASPTYPSDAKLYCGVIIIVLVTLYFFNKKIGLRKKISMLCFMSFILLSIHVRLFEYIWNAFHQPNGYVGRNTFLLVFLIILVSYESFLNIKQIPRKAFLYCTFIIFIFCTFTIKKYDITYVLFNTLFNFLIIILYEIIIYMYTKKSEKLFAIPILLLVLIELTFNCVNSIYQYTTVSQYRKNYGTTLSLLSHTDNNKSEKIKNDFKIYKNMGSLCLYSSIPTVSSTANNNINHMLSHLGYFSSLNATNDVSWEPVSASMLGIKYIFSESPDYSSEILKLSESSTAADKYIYNNEYYLSTAFAVDKDFNKINISESDTPFDTINQLSNDVYHCGNIYEKFNLCTTNGTITIPANSDIYLYCKTILNDCELIYDNKRSNIYPTEILGVTIHNDFYENNYIYHLPNTINGGNILCQTNCTNSNIAAYTLNIKNFKRLMKELSKYQMELTSFDDTYISGTIESDEVKQVFTSIPYSSGWTVTVDGQKVKTDKCFNALLSFCIPEGSHKIEFFYVTPGLTTGCIVSIFSFIILLFVTIKKRSEVNIHE